MALLTNVNTAEAGATVTGAAAAGGGDTADNTYGKTLLLVRNGGGSSINVTITAQNTSFSNDKLGTVTKGNTVKAVAAGGMEIFGPFPPNVYNNASGQIAISYSAVTSVTVTAIKLN